MEDQAALVLSTQMNGFVLSMIARGQRYCLLAVTLIAGVILTAWLVPPVRPLLPGSWWLQRPHASVGLLLCVASLVLSRGRRPRWAMVLSRVLAVVVVLVAVETLREAMLGDHSFVDLLFRTHCEASMTLLGVVLLGMRARTGAVSRLVDAATVALCLLVMTYTAVYLFAEIGLFEKEVQNWVSIQTLLCFNLLTVVVVARRAEYGAFAVLLDNGIGGKSARLALPFTLTLPFLLAILRPLLVNAHVLYPGYATAVATSVTSLLGFLLILVLARRINGLEQEIRDLSLRDDLTQLYNRRGFYVLAEQARLLARREEEPFSVLYLDVDNLKPTNDTLGHEAGSALLREMAEILRGCFRETDVVGRLGGDEFMVAGRLSEEEMGGAIRRLEEMAEEGNGSGKRAYLLGFSLGVVTAETGEDKSLDEMVAASDRIMYAQKREKKAKARNGLLVSARQGDARGR
jgi:diguanylate cyclase (GGDEF)-like protein